MLAASCRPWGGHLLSNVGADHTWHRKVWAQAPASHAPTAASLRSLLRSECHCSPHTPQQLCSCWRVNKPASAVPVLFTPAPWACSGWRDGTGGLCCVSSSLERRSKPFITKLPFLPVLNGVLFYFFSCQRERHETWLCDPNPWTSSGAGESWKFDLVPTGPGTRATE